MSWDDAEELYTRLQHVGSQMLRTGLSLEEAVSVKEDKPYEVAANESGDFEIKNLPAQSVLPSVLPKGQYQLGVLVDTWPGERGVEPGARRQRPPQDVVDRPVPVTRVVGVEPLGQRPGRPDG